MPNRNAQVMTVLAGAVALAGVGYALAHRSEGRSVRPSRRGRAMRGSAASPPNRAEAARSPAPAPAVIATEPAARPDLDLAAERISSAPDALDIALDLDGVFDGKSESDVLITARPNEHVPVPRAGDDEEAPAPDDLARTWLTHATESERSLGTADTIPDVEELQLSMDQLGDTSDASVDAVDDDAVDDDETTAEYVRRHRISLDNLNAETGKKHF